MKRIYTTLLATLIASLTFGQNGQIVNGGFENWTTNDIYDTPNEWISANSTEWQGVATILQSSEASDGLSSCEITAKETGSAPDTTFGFVLHGTIGAGGPDGGIAYTDVFDEITFDYQSDLPVGDTLYMLAIRYDAGGNPIEEIFLPAAFGTNATWMNGSIMVPSTPQTELLIGFVIGDPFNGGSPTPDTWARIDNVRLFNSSTQTANLPNFSFEQWTTVSLEEPDSWYTFNEMIIGAGIQNSAKTTDANSGNFAIELTTVYNPNWDDTVGGFVSIGSINMSGPNPFSPIPYVASPTNFEYAYKYAPTNGDPSGGIMIEFFENGASIGLDFINVTAQATYFTGSLALTYVGTPDSLVLAAFSGDSLGSVLKLDDLAFTGGDVGVDEFSKMNINIYPNPASEMVMIKADGLFTYQIIDLAGNLVRSSNDVLGVQEINIRTLESGTYIVKISNGNSIETHKLMVQ